MILHRLAPILLLLGLVARPASGQVNIERLRLDADSLGLTGAVALTFELETGNTEKRRSEGEARLDYTWPTRTVFGIVRGDFDWTGGRRISEKGLLHLRHIVRTDRRVSPEVFGQVNYDRARELDRRGLIGGGIRIGLASGERGRASVGVAYMFEREELSIPAESVHPTATSHHRASSFVTVSFEPRDGLAVASTSYIQPRLDAPDDLRVLSQSRMAVTVLGPFSLDVTFDLYYDADPPDGIESLDASLQTGVGVRF